MCGVKGLRFILFLKITFDPLVYAQDAVNSGESPLALKLRHCHPTYSLPFLLSAAGRAKSAADTGSAIRS